MKIAQIAPLAESTPPRLYGGTERVVAYLTEELERLGHDVRLFGSGAQAERQAQEFDVLHFHLEHDQLASLRPFARKTLVTLHGRLERLAPSCRELGNVPLVSLSRAQRAPLAGANWAGTVYPGLAPEVCPFNPASRGRTLAFFGRASPRTELERAQAIARGANARLRVAASFEEIAEEAKPALLGNAAALLFPVERPEPFDLTLIEAMSCGTPVIAFPRGAVPEIVEHGITGFLVDSVEQAVEAVRRLGGLERAGVRRRFEERFSAARMARDYLAVYRSLGRVRAASAA